MTEIVLDATADGKPTHEWYLVLAAVAMLGFAGFKLYQGQYVDAVESALIAGWMYLVDYTRRVWWKRGYADAASSIVDQLVDDPDSVEVER